MLDLEYSSASITISQSHASLHLRYGFLSERTPRLKYVLHAA